MNRAPVALFALLCTLASSMVAAGVANDRPNGLSKSPLKTIGFVGSAQEKWLTQPSWQAIDIHRTIALPTKKLPVRAAEQAPKVAAVIITIEQPQAAPKPAAKVVAEKVPAKAVAAAKPVAKEASKTSTATIVKAASVNVENLKQQFTKTAIALKPAVIQPRVTSLFSTTYAPKSNLVSVLPSNKISLADLHLCKPAVAKTMGSLIVFSNQPFSNLPAPVVNNSNKVTLGGGKLEIAYGSVELIAVGGSSWTASPYITQNGAGILPKVLSTNTSVDAATKAISGKAEKQPARTSTLKSTTTNLGNLHPAVVRSSSDVAELGRQLNRAAAGLVAQYRTVYLPKWMPFSHTDHNAPAIKSAQLKSGEHSAVKK